MLKGAATLSTSQVRQSLWESKRAAHRKTNNNEKGARNRNSNWLIKALHWALLQFKVYCEVPSFLFEVRAINLGWMRESGLRFTSHIMIYHTDVKQGMEKNLTKRRGEETRRMFAKKKCWKQILDLFRLRKTQHKNIQTFDLRQSAGSNSTKSINSPCSLTKAEKN